MRPSINRCALPFFHRRVVRMTLFWHQHRQIYDFLRQSRQHDDFDRTQWGHKQLIRIFTEDFEGSRRPRLRQSRERRSEPRGLGAGRARVSPPPRRLVWRFREVWRACCFVPGSTRREARGFGGFLQTYKPGVMSSSFFAVYFFTSIDATVSNGR